MAFLRNDIYANSPFTNANLIGQGTPTAYVGVDYDNPTITAGLLNPNHLECDAKLALTGWNIAIDWRMTWRVKRTVVGNGESWLKTFPFDSGNNGHLQLSMYWNTGDGGNNLINIELDNAAGTQIFSTNGISFSSGTFHDIVLECVSGVLTAKLDGVTLGSGARGSTTGTSANIYFRINDFSTDTTAVQFTKFEEITSGITFNGKQSSTFIMF